MVSDLTIIVLLCSIFDIDLDRNGQSNISYESDHKIGLLYCVLSGVAQRAKFAEKVHKPVRLGL